MKPKIPIAEIFGPTIQGEGPNAGARCIFVRVKGCTFACQWCDSKHTWFRNESHIEEFDDKDLTDKLLNMCQDTHCCHIVLTGGNPCMYDFSEVIRSLHSKDIRVDVETQGDLLPSWLREIDTIVFSPKGPSSGMPDTYEDIKGYMNTQWQDSNNLMVAVKIPIFNDEDVEFARKFSKFVNKMCQEWSGDYCVPMKMYLSIGNSDVDTTESIRDRVLTDYESLLNKINENPEDFEHVYILPQIHTLVWGNKQGV